MKRDMDLARQILLDVEGSEAGGEDLAGVAVEIDGKSRRDLDYHVRLLEEAGLLVTNEVSERDDSGMIGPRLIVSRLTWEGHEFLDNSRDEGLWAKAKEQIKIKVGGVGFDVLKQLLAKMATTAVLGS